MLRLKHSDDVQTEKKINLVIEMSLLRGQHSDMYVCGEHVLRVCMCVSVCVIMGAVCMVC